jgi:hypothetical protein
MIWRIALRIVIIAAGVNTFNQVTLDYKYSTESPRAEQLGVVTGAFLLCLLVLRVNRKKKP